MFASICRRRLLVVRLRQIPVAGVTDPPQRNPSAVLLSYGYSTATLADAAGSDPCPATVSYLVSCGLSPATAAARSCRFRIRSTEKADAVCALLRQYGFSDADIAETVRRAPALLSSDTDRILRPKLDLLISLGIQPRKIATTPWLLMRSLDNHLVPRIQFLRGIVGTDDAVCRAISHYPRALMIDLEKSMRPAVEALRRLGLPEDALRKLVTIEMRILMVSPGRIGEIFEELKALGICVTAKGSVYSLRVLSGISKETRKRKVALYQSFGVPEGDLRNAIRKQPTMLFMSDENIKKKLQFLLDVLKLELSDVMRRPVIIGYSLEKTTMPRCAVLSVLMRKGMIEPDIKLLNALLGSAKQFSEKYVLRYANNVPDVVKAYEGKIKFEGF